MGDEVIISSEFGNMINDERDRKNIRLEHPMIYNGKENGVLPYRLEYEAAVNNKTFDEWINILKTKSFTGKEIFLEKDTMVHHKDGDCGNNKLYNLQPMSRAEHAQMHKIGFPIKAKIENIIEIGETEVYDLEVEDTHNYLAGGFIVHNSGAYADNELIFQKKFNEILPNALNLQNKVEVLNPISNLMKREIVKLGLDIKAPLHLTWSCYEDGDVHCGMCGPCLMRRVGFKMNKIKDMIPYKDLPKDFWEDM
jgi:hypothetical protein